MSNIFSSFFITFTFPSRDRVGKGPSWSRTELTRTELTRTEIVTDRVDLTCCPNPVYARLRTVPVRTYVDVKPTRPFANSTRVNSTTEKKIFHNLSRAHEIIDEDFFFDRLQTRLESTRLPKKKFSTIYLVRTR